MARKSGKSGGVSAKDVQRTTWVLVASPEGIQNGTALEVGGEMGRGETGAPFEVLLGRNQFRLRTSAATWGAEAECRPARPARPQQVMLAKIPSARVLRAEQAPSLVAAAGKPPKIQTVVYVHGIGNKPTASVLKCQWDAALFGTPMGDRTRMAYWVDRDRYPSPVAATCGDPDRTTTEDDEATTSTIMALAGAEAPVAGPEREAEALHREIDALAKDGAQHRTLEGIAARIAATAEVEPPARPSNRPGIASARLLPLPLPWRRTIARLFTRVLLRDVNDFLFDPTKRQRMRDVLWERLRGGGQPFAIIAHSQGSMVAYELLRELGSDDCEVPLFVTVGSPLGLQEVQDYFRADGSSLKTPECVGRWINIADNMDPVALDSTLKGEYASNSRGVEVEDQHHWWLNKASRGTRTRAPVICNRRRCRISCAPRLGMRLRSRSRPRWSRATSPPPPRTAASGIRRTC